jgi:hypothetical protein
MSAEMPSSPETGRPGPHWYQIVVIVLLLVGIILTAFFGVRLVRSAAQLHHNRLPPGTTDVQLIRGWMTIPYIARVYRVPEAYLWQGLGIPEAGNRHRSIEALGVELGYSETKMLDKVQAIILTYQAQHTPVPVVPTRPPDPFNPKSLP